MEYVFHPKIANRSSHQQKKPFTARVRQPRVAVADGAEAEIYCSEGSDRPSLDLHLVNKAPKEHLDFRKLIIGERSANIGLY